jgi:hypothetical protein
MALGRSAFVQAHIDAHLDVKTISPSHHYATPSVFMNRILQCICDVTDLATTHAICRHANVTSDAEIVYERRSRPPFRPQASQVQTASPHGRPNDASTTRIWPRKPPGSALTGPTAHMPAAAAVDPVATAAATTGPTGAAETDSAKPIWHSSLTRCEPRLQQTTLI